MPLHFKSWTPLLQEEAAEPFDLPVHVVEVLDAARGVKMSTIVVEALASKDAKQIKQVRAVEKGRVTRKVDRLLKILDITDRTTHDNISKIEVKETELGLREAMKNVEMLHDRYQIFRQQGKDAPEEEKLEKEENEYIVLIEDKYHLALAAKERFDVDCEITKKRELFKAAQDDFENQKVEIVDTINSEDEKIRKTAANKKENFQKSLENLLKISRDLMGYVGMRNTSVMTKEEFDCGKEQKNAKEIMQKLDIAINEEKEQQISILSLPQHNSTAIQSHGDSFLKLKKLSAPKFSGLSREFAKFKRDFNTLVAVEGRNDVEIGATLKESIPRKYHHLVDNLALDH